MKTKEKRARNYPIFETDNGNLTYIEHTNGTWEKRTFDDKNRMIEFNHSSGGFVKREFDENDNVTYREDSTGQWFKCDYDADGNQINKTTSNDDAINFYNKIRKFFFLKKITN